MTILTDLSDVLIQGVKQTASAIADDFGSYAGVECYRRLHATYDPYFLDLLRGKLTEDEYCEIFFSDGEEWPFTAEDIKQTFSEGFKIKVPHTLGVYKSIIGHPLRLDEQLYTVPGSPDIYIVSDHIMERLEEIKSYHPDIFGIMKGEIWSCEVGKIKQDKGFFPELLKELKLDPAEVVFVDDNEINTCAATEAGITSILFKNATQLKHDLIELGFWFDS